MPANVYYQDEYTTEYDDGTEEHRFSDAEWNTMHRDPVYYEMACRNGHSFGYGNGRTFYENTGDCVVCFNFMESGPDMDDEMPPADYPMVRCGHCQDRFGGSPTYHVGVGGVERCSWEQVS